MTIQELSFDKLRTMLKNDYFGEGVYLFLGASDTGKTTLISETAAQIAGKGGVAIVDADTGQSHIGPPGTVGWAIARQNEKEPGRLPVEGIAFVGQTSPVGHLLQLTTALVRCVEQAKSKAKTVLIDTPGFVSGAAACAFWWEVVRLLKPKAIIAVSKQNELDDILKGLVNCGWAVETIKCGDEVKAKSPEQRRAFRQEKFAEYFAQAGTYEVSLKGIGVQAFRKLSKENALGLLIGLRDAESDDIAMGFIIEWYEEDKVVFKSPGIDTKKVRCIVVGDATVDLPI
jgi:polynucleotide 5'-kinase involved in rRNA processing